MVSAAFLHTFHHQKVDYFVIMILSQINLGDWVDLFIWGLEFLVLLKGLAEVFRNDFTTLRMLYCALFP